MLNLLLVIIMRDVFASQIFLMAQLSILFGLTRPQHFLSPVLRGVELFTSLLPRQTYLLPIVILARARASLLMHQVLCKVTQVGVSKIVKRAVEAVRSASPHRFFSFRLAFFNI